MKLPERILVLAPHPDDEVLMCAGVIRRAVLQGSRVFVAVVSSGGYLCPDFSEGNRRMAESLDAMAFLGVKEEDVFLMGYPDTGMEKELSFLTTLQETTDLDLLFPTERGETTHGIAGGKQDFRMERSGRHARITKGDFLADLTELIQIANPQLIVTSSRADLHGNHVALYFFVSDLVKKIYAYNAEKPIIWESLVHSSLGDDVWPIPDTPFDDFSFVPGLEAFGQSWEQRVRIPMPEEMLGTSLENSMKYQAIQKYLCVVPEIQRYFQAFVKKEEIFWETVL